MVTTEINGFSNKLKELSKKHMPKEGFATFKLLATPTPVDAADSTNRRFTLDRLPSRWRMLREESIIDPGTNRPVTLANLKGYRRGSVPGAPQEPIIGEIEFIGAAGGLIDVPYTDLILFERLLFSNYNKDNPNPSAVEPELGYKFGLVKPAEDAKTTLAKVLAVSRAMNAVAELSDAAIERATDKLNLPTHDRNRKLSVEEMALRLTEVAQTEPERIESVLESGEAKLEEKIEEARQLNLIDFVEEAQQWRWKATQEPICEAVQGFKPEEALVQYIQKNANGPQFSQMLVSRIAQAKR